MAQRAQQTKTLYWSSIASSLGISVVMATEVGICWAGTPGTSEQDGLAWTKRTLQPDRVVEGENSAPLQHAMNELRRYFAGEAMQFTCPLDLHGTAFQVAVWREMLSIPYGDTRSYGEIAHAIGRPAAARAVGAASGANPIALMVPCHRVIGSNGALTGYGGGLPMKEALLSFEQPERRGRGKGGLALGHER